MATKKESMKLASANALNSMFTQGVQNDQEGKETNSTKNVTGEEPKSVKKANKKATRTFSFRPGDDNVAQFRAYCFAKYGMTVDQVGERAMIEYMENHPLEKFEKDLYNSKLAEERAKNE